MTTLDPQRLEALQEQLRFAYDPWFRGYHKLMAYRVRSILMVSNAYESFSIEGDAGLEYSIYGTSQSLQLRVIPQITRAVQGSDALDALGRDRFDLILVSANLPDMEVSEFAAAAKALAPTVPVIMLVFDGRWFDLAYEGVEPELVDWIFAWRGSPSVILSIIKLAEDRANIDRDIQLASVGTVVVIEDSVERYSALLPPLFMTLLARTLALTPEGLNDSDRMARSRVRPKVLLARTFGEARALVDKYSTSLLAVISDLHTIHDDRMDRDSGPHFLRECAARFPGVPILVQSSEPDGHLVAASIGARFLDKRSPHLANVLEQFVLEDIGFGSFVFRDSSGRLYAEVSNLWEMEDALATVPDDSILYHAERNELSHWFRARGETTLAALVRPVSPTDFPTTAGLREYLRSAVAIARVEKHRGVIADFRAGSFDPTYPFVVMGKGSLGGKGRGLAFIFHVLSHETKDGLIEGVRVRIPRTLIIATSEFDAFVKDNRIDLGALESLTDAEVRDRFYEACLPAELVRNLREYLERVTCPLSVRSSSILEDSHYQPCAGLYATYFLPNNDASLDLRLDQLCRAVALVYASVYLKTPRQYHAATGMNIAEEKMAVVIQELFGRAHGSLFYPTFAGIAHSHNYYPVGDMRPEDGTATVALGMGKHVVEGGEALRFCPKYPRVLPQFSSPAMVLKASQRDFLALDLSAHSPDLRTGSGATLLKLPLTQAETDGELQAVGSVVSADDDRVYDGLGRQGARVVTFSRFLRSPDTPLCRLLQRLLELGRKNLGCSLEVEFAANVTGGEFDFAFLQIRPFVAQKEARHVHFDDIPKEKTICRCRRAMGNGRIEAIRDIVYVHPSRFDRAASRGIARLVGQLNAELSRQRRPYLLIGPGRWGTLDPWLGIPVVWHQLSHAKVIVEVPAKDIMVEPSQGTHFFHNMVAAGVGYLSLANGDSDDFMRWDLLDAMPAEELSDSVRHVRLPAPLTVRIHGGKQEAIIALGH